MRITIIYAFVAAVLAMVMAAEVAAAAKRWIMRRRLCVAGPNLSATAGLLRGWNARQV